MSVPLHDPRAQRLAHGHHGPGVVGTEVAKKIAREFLRAQYAGGRHQIRVDMLNKMA